MPDARGGPRTAPSAARGWTMLAGAIVCEVTATLALRAAVDAPLWFVLVAAGYLASFTCLSLALRAGLPLGVAYGIWGAVGVALVAVMAYVLYGEALTLLSVAGLALIIGGVLLIELGSRHAARRAAGRAARAAGRADTAGARARRTEDRW